MTSLGKFLITCSKIDNLVIVYNYQTQEEHCAISLDHSDPNQGVEEDERPCALCSFKDHNTQSEYLLIGTTYGQVLLFNLDAKEF
jgi:hypothetical protein